MTREVRKYSFDWSDSVTVECPEMDAFLEDLQAVFRKHGASFEQNSYSEGGGYLVPCAYDGDMDMYRRHLDDYYGGIPWLDRAKAEWKKLKEAYYAEYAKREAIARENRDRQEFDRLKRKFEGAQ